MYCIMRLWFRPVFWVCDELLYYCKQAPLPFVSHVHFVSVGCAQEGPGIPQWELKIEGLLLEEV